MEKSVSTKNTSWIISSAKCGLLAFVISAAGVLLLALIAKLTTMSADILPIISQIIKAVAVGVAVLVCVRGQKTLFQAIICAVIFALLNMILYISLGGQINWGQVGLDVGISLLVAVVVAMVFCRKK